MKITDKFSNGLPKISLLWIFSMFLIQVATLITMYLLHMQRIFFGHWRPEQKLIESVWWSSRACVISLTETMIMIIGAVLLAVKAHKRST